MDSLVILDAYPGVFAVLAKELLKVLTVKVVGGLTR